MKKTNLIKSIIKIILFSYIWFILFIWLYFTLSSEERNNNCMKIFIEREELYDKWIFIYIKDVGQQHIEGINDFKTINDFDLYFWKNNYILIWEINKEWKITYYENEFNNNLNNKKHYFFNIQYYYIWKILYYFNNIF